MQYVDFVKQLGKVGIVLINTRDENGKPLNLVNADVETLSVLTEDQIDALQAAIDDVERRGVESVTMPDQAPNLPGESSTLSWVEWLDGLGDEPMQASKSLFEGLANEAFRDGQAKALAEIDAIPINPARVVDSLDAIAWANDALPGGGSAPRVAWSPTALAGWFALAIEAGRQANRVRGLNSDDDAVAFDVSEANAVEFVMAEGGKAWLNVDGRCRARFGRTSIVIVENSGNREVWRKPVEADAKA